MNSNLLMLLIVTLMMSSLTIQQKIQLAYSWPTGTTEETMKKIMSVESDMELTAEEFAIADDTVYEIFDRYDQKSQEITDLMDCGFLEAIDSSKTLQCWQNKGHKIP